MTGIGSQYLLAMADADKSYFDGSKTYKVTLPKGIPGTVGQRWHLPGACARSSDLRARRWEGEVEYARSRTARVMKTLMRNGRDRRSENPGWATRRKSARFCLGPISGSHQGQRPNGCIQRPDTWLHPNASLIVRFLLHPPYRVNYRDAAICRRSGAKRTRWQHEPDTLRRHSRQSSAPKSEDARKVVSNAPFSAASLGGSKLTKAQTSGARSPAGDCPLWMALQHSPR
jgi:hypothetical protein